MNIHRAKLRWSPKLGHIVHRRICPWIRDRLRRWREAVNAVALRDENRPKIKNLVCWGGVCVTVRVPVAFRNKCERVTGPQPERVRSIFAGVNATRTSGTGPERDRNANRNKCEHGLRELDILCGDIDTYCTRHAWQQLYKGKPKVAPCNTLNSPEYYIIYFVDNITLSPRFLSV